MVMRPGERALQARARRITFIQLHVTNLRCTEIYKLTRTRRAPTEQSLRTPHRTRYNHFTYPIGRGSRSKAISRGAEIARLVSWYCPRRQPPLRAGAALDSGVKKLRNQDAFCTPKDVRHLAGIRTGGYTVPTLQTCYGFWCAGCVFETRGPGM